MPQREPEPLPTIIRMRVVSKKAPRYPESGWIVDTQASANLTHITLQFEEDGKCEKYERSELELVMP